MFCRPFQGGASFFRFFWLFMLHVYLCHAVLSASCSLVVIFWERADLLALLCVVFVVYLSLSHMVFKVRFGT